MASEERLRIIVEAQDKASQALRGVERQADSLQTAVAGLQRVATFTFAGIGLREVGRLTIQLGQAGAAAERMRDSFEGLAGGNAVAILEELRETSRGTIDDVNLMTAANRAMMLGVTQDAETMGRILEIAMVRGRAMGLSTQQAFSDLVTGLGRASPMILDNLGIVTGGERTFAAYAEQLGKTAEELTEVERRQALLNKVLLETSGEAAPDAQEKIEQYQAQLARLKQAFGAGLGGEGGLVSGAAGLGAGLFSGLAGYFEGAQRAREVTLQFEDALDQARESGEITTAQWWAMRAAAWAAGSGAELLGGHTTEFYDALRAINPKIADHILMLENVREISSQAAYATLSEADAMYALANGSMAAASGISRLSAAEAARSGYGVPMDPWLVRRAQDPNAGRGVSVQDTINRDAEALRDYQAEWNRTSVSVGGSMRDLNAELRSLAESLLQPSQVSALDVAQTKLGTYTDKWDEYARRVRAAGNDVKSQWRNLVPLDILAQGEDAIKAWAAAEEEAFYAGQRPDQMNWDAFIANARAEVEKQLSRENLVNEAMARLAAAGIGGLSRADVAKQFGVADTATVGTDMAQQTVTGMTTVDAGKQFTEAFNTQFRAQEARWMEFGSLSVTWFGVGVQNGVASGAADTLVNALVPRIQEKLQGRP